MHCHTAIADVGSITQGTPLEKRAQRQLTVPGNNPTLENRLATMDAQGIDVDSMVFTPEGLRHLAVEVGPRLIMIGTDYGFQWVTDPVGHVLGTPGLSDADKVAILGGTAAKLLRLGEEPQQLPSVTPIPSDSDRCRASGTGLTRRSARR